MADDRSIFLAKGWSQFSIVRPNDHASLCKLAHIDVNPEDLLLIVTQTCDLISDVGKEPFFEIVCLRPLGRPPSGDYLNGKNSRCLELTLDLPGSPPNWSILAHERFFARHEILRDIRPCLKIEDDNTKDLLISWITKRYNRTAFPEAFEQRWKGRIKHIEGVIKKLKLVKDIYIQLEPLAEIEAAEEYKVELILLMDAENYDHPLIYEEYDELRRQLEKHFSKCDGIDIEDISLVSNAGISLKEIQLLKRWDYSYLSYRDPQTHDLPNGD